MTRYDPMKPLDHEAWKELGETEQFELVERFHKKIRAQTGNARLHATIHVIVENQVALGDEIPVAAAFARLQREGLDRHDAIHAIGSKLIVHMQEVASGLRDGKGGDINAIYYRELAALTARTWREQG